MAGSIRPPGSKSITNRALVCAALADGRSTLSGVLESEDTLIMMQALRELGLAVEFDDVHSVATVDGRAGKMPAANAQLQVGNSGTTVRFLAAMLAACEGRFHLDGSKRMRERPIEPLLASLRSLGCEATSDLGTGCPPITIHSRGLAGGTTQVAGDVSSQFLSGLLLSAPYAKSPLTIEVPGDLVSVPYVEMTLAVMQSFGMDVKTLPNRKGFWVNAPRCYVPCNYAIEPDASAASYYFAAAAITGGTVTVEGLDQSSLQGDVRFCDALARMGCHVTYGAGSTSVRGGPLRGIDIDMNAISDTVQTLAAVALFAEGPTCIRGVAHIRHKESDRIGDLCRELRKLGAHVEEREDGMLISPSVLISAEIETYQDHRMAMSLALVGLKQPGVVIRDPSCVSKTYPRYFEDMDAFTAPSRR